MRNLNEQTLLFLSLLHVKASYFREYTEAKQRKLKNKQNQVIPVKSIKVVETSDNLANSSA